MVKYKSVLQHSEEDCGAACLASITKYYQRNLSMGRIREAVGTGQLGTTLLGLRRGAEALGFNARQVKATSQLVDRIDEVPLPAIIHWKGRHWVVLYGRRGKKYIISDPAVGLRYLKREELIEGWGNGIMLLLVPDENRFYQEENEEVAGFARFLKRVWPYRQLLLEVLIINIVIGVLSLAIPILFQILTDEVLVRGDAQLLTVVAIGVVAINIFSSALQLLQSNLIAHFAQRLELGFILEFGHQLLRLPLSYFDSRRSGEIISRLRDIKEINQLIFQVIIRLPSESFIALISYFVMLFYNWKLTILATILAFVMTLSTVILMPALQQKTRTLLVMEAENQGLLVEHFKGALTIKTNNAAPQAWEEFQSRFGRLATIAFRTSQIGIINGVFSGLVSGIGTITLLWFGGILVIERELSIGQLLAFVSLERNFSTFIRTIVQFIDEFARAKTAVERMNEVIEATPETQDKVQKPWVIIPDNADIVCTKLNYHHAGRIDLLKEFSLTIPGGKVTALIGKSGCGKSTLVKLIANLYQLQSGNIRFGVYNQQDISLECLREQIVLVPQQSHFWSRSILDNFRFCHPYASFEQIVRVCQISAADEFISELPDKYQTVLGEFGANLSGGQLQRLAIARAIVNNPPILILDESTNALDPVIEDRVLDELLDYRKSKTTIIISHSPRVILRADEIVFLEKGELKVSGSQEELRQISGEHLNFLIP